MNALSNIGQVFLMAGLWVVLFGGPMAALAQPAVRAEGTLEPPTIMVNGHAEVAAAPDQAVVRLGAQVQADEASAAQQQVNTIMGKAIADLRKLGVPEEKIQTAELSIQPVYSQTNAARQEEPKIVGFRATNTLSITLDDIKLVGQVVDAGVAAGANQVEGIAFQLKDDSKQRQEALRQAVLEARAKANVMAEALGVKIEGIEQVVEGGYMPRPMNYGGGMMMMAKAEAAPAPVQPGQVKVEGNVTIRFRLAHEGRAGTVAP
jgi:uncharacterized protein